MELQKITCSPKQSKELRSLGIDLPGHLMHYKNGENPSHWITEIFGRGTGYEAAPAWTKEEIDVMIGPVFMKPDLPEPKFAGKAHDPNAFHVYLPDKMLIFKSGAEASAEFLIYLLKMGKISVKGCIERYKEIYKP